MDGRVGLDREARDEARIAATRARHEELRQRLLNPAVRLAGRDEGALGQQVAERQAAKARSREEEAEYARQVAEVQERLAALDAEQAEARRAANKERLEHWTSEAERKAALKRAELAEYHTVPTHFGVSSAQVLDGEDRSAAQRKLLQFKQMQQWVAEQGADKQRRMAAEQSQEREYAAWVRAQTEAMHAAEHARAAERARVAAETRRFNETQSKLKLDSAKFERDVAAEHERRELEAAAAREDALEDAPASQLGAHRVRPDHYRGMSAANAQALREEQERHLRLRSEAKERERWEDQEEARREAEMNQLANTIFAQQLEQRRQADKDLQLAQLRQADERRARERAAKDEIKYGPAFTDDFFGNFGRSHR